VLIDISDPTDPAIVGQIGMPWAQEVFASNGYVYVANYTEGLTVVNATDPSTPVIVGNVDTPTEATNVFVSGKYAEVGDWYTGLQVVDITNPSNPVIVWCQDLAAGAAFQDIVVSDNYAYITLSDKLEVWNIIDPAHPTLAGTNRAPQNVRAMQIVGGYLYMTGWNNFEVWHIKDPANPVYTGSVADYAFFFNQSIYSAFVSGGYAYIGNGGDGLSVVDLNVCGLK
jgi:hypothetical protein